MATEKCKQRSSGHVKEAILQELLNFSGSSDDDTSSPLSVPSSKPVHSVVKPHDGKSGPRGNDKENVRKRSGLMKKANVESDANVISDRKPIKTNRKERKINTGSTALQQASKHVQSEKKTKKTMMYTKPKPKRSPDVRNMTLAGLGILFDISDSSDGGDEKVEKESVELIYGNKNRDLPHSHRGTAKSTRKQPIGGASLEDGSIDCKPKVKSSNQTSATAGKALPSSDLPGNKVHPSTVSKALSSADQNPSSDFGSETKDSVSMAKADKTGKTAAASVKFKLMKNVLASDGRTESQHNLQSLKHQVSLQHPNVSIIRSARLSGNLIDASPSEESLLPLSESTRLDCPENVTAPKQSSGHLLAHQNSPGLLNSPFEENQDSSYEQLKIGAKKGAPESPVVNNLVEIEKEIKTGEVKNSHMTSGVETSESDSQYMTCLASPDVSSMYEAVDVSVQTSFKYGVSGSDGIEGVEDIFTENSNDISGFRDPHSNRELASKHANPSEHCEGSEGETEAKEYSECHSETESEMDPDQSLDLKSVPLQVSASKEKSCNEDNDLPLTSPDVCSKKNVMLTSTKKQAAESHEKVEDITQSKSPHPRGSTLPSDSNYYSESHSDVNSTSGSSDIIRHNRKPVKANSHEPFASLPEELHGLELGSCVNKEEGFMSAKQDPAAVERTSCQRLESPDVCLFPAHKPRSGRHQETVSGLTGRWSPKKCVDSSSEDDDDSKLEAFFQTMRTTATKPDKKAVENDDLDDFVVNDSDVTDSEEETCDDLADSPCVALLSDSEFLPRTRSSRRETVKSRSSHHSAAQRVSSSEDDGDSCNDEDNDDDNDKKEDEDDDLFHGLTTPRSRMIPTYSQSQTPRQVSPKWYTPATSMKTKPRRGVNGTERKALVSSARVQGKIDSSDAWVTPACLSQGGQRNTLKPLDFLCSLSLETPDHLRDGEARGYIVHFKQKQGELSSRLFKLFNFTVFENQLPADLPVVWNKRLLKTAGLCKLKRVGDQYTATIELSTKVCDSAERVRDTLIHEMCHAAVWILNKAKEGHGRYWRYWAGKANRAHPEIPVIRRCHDYSISTKYIYRCVKCGYQLGRHSKSLDTEKKVCGHCRGRFQLLASGSRHGSNASSVSATPRTPNPFAMFVKENYGSVKREGGGLPHKEVMEALSREFAKTKINFS